MSWASASRTGSNCSVHVPSTVMAPPGVRRDRWRDDRRSPPAALRTRPRRSHSGSVGNTRSMSDPEPVLVRETRGDVLVLRLNRPDARNSLSSELISEIGLGLEAAENDAAVRCVVLTGTGDRAFCAGMDLRGFAEGTTP